MDADDDRDESRDLTLRFLTAIGTMWKMAMHKPPDAIFGKLHVNQFQALHLIHRQPGISQKSLAEAMQVTPAAISTAIREMEHVGLVERKPDENDARLMCVFISQHGQAMLDQMQEQRYRAMAEVLRFMPIEEQRMVVEALERAVKAKQDEISRQPDGG
jgi:DNA-binding MarR family transcriptional regulator